MKIKRLLTLSPKEQDIIEDFGDLIIEICNKVERDHCKTGCIFKNFCSFPNDVSDNFLELLKKEFQCDVNSNFED